MNPLYRLLIPLGLGLFAAGVNFVLIRKATATVEILVAAEDIPAGVPLTAEKLGRVAVKKDPALFGNTFQVHQTSSVLQMTLRFPLKKGEVLLRPNIEEDGSASRPDLLKPKHVEWIFTVRPDDVSPDLTVGEWVKVMVRPLDTSSGGEPVGPVQVLAVLRSAGNARDPLTRVNVAVPAEWEERVRPHRSGGRAGSADVLSVFRVAR